MGCGSSQQNNVTGQEKEITGKQAESKQYTSTTNVKTTKTSVTQTPPAAQILVQDKSSNAKETTEIKSSKTYSESVANTPNKETAKPETKAENTTVTATQEKSTPGIKEQESTSTAVSTTAGSQGKIVMDKPDGSKVKVTGSSESYLPTEPESQRRFDTTLRSACLLVKPDSVVKTVDKHVTRLRLHQALPHTYSLFSLVKKLENLQVLDLSNNSLGPQGFRCVCLAMCSNNSIVSLNLAGNKSDTDSAECVGRMLSLNKSLVYLDVSSNNLGKDYFSRCVGPSLKANTTLQTLRAQSIGSTDMKVLLENLVHNSSLTEIDLSSNSLSDRTSLGKGFSQWLKSSTCSLTTLSLSSCDMNPASLTLLCEAISHNMSLTELNINGNEENAYKSPKEDVYSIDLKPLQFGSLSLVCKFIVAACCQGNMRNLHMNDARVKDQGLSLQDLSEAPTSSPALQVLSLHSSNVSNCLFSEMKKWSKGRQLHITDLDITNNPSLTPDCVDDIISVTSGEKCIVVPQGRRILNRFETSTDETGKSCLHRLTFGMNNAENLSRKLNMSSLPSLTYLNLRKAKLNTGSMIDVCGVCLSSDSSLSTLVLDGLKLAGTDVLKEMAAKVLDSKLTTLSLGGCSLADADLSPLCDLLSQGHPLHMLKLSANRITDTGVTNMVEALLKQKTHPLEVLDLSNNTIGNDGAVKWSQIFTNKSHKTSLHSLNLAGNSIGKDGVTYLVSAVGGKSPLKTLYLNDQQDAIAEVDMEQVYKQLATTLGFKFSKTGDDIQPSSSDLPSLPDGLMINLSKLGGQPGSLGRMLHSRAVVTDTSQDLLTGLTLSGVLELVAGLQGLESGDCVLSSEDWNWITGANKDRAVPSWLQLSGHRERAVYLSNLPGNASVQKLEGMLEMEADCSVDEVVLMKDPVTRSNSGVAWVLLCDTESVRKAIDFFLQGEAKVFGQPFSISRICVKVDDEKNSQLEAKAREDVEARSRARRTEDAAHRALIQQNTEESWKRHAYRLAHPAYADGRIW